jgi:aryl-alcohol dehydrogenase-like predicted oxidoreductase
MTGWSVGEPTSVGLPAPDALHPSGPLPVQGRGVGAGVRVDLGETGLSVFPLALGGAEFGWNVDVEASHAVLDSYAERGGNMVHTADSFSGGRSEHIIGQWLRTRGTRDATVVAVRVGRHPDNPGLGSVNLVRAVEASLRRLDTDRIDVLYLDAHAGDAAPLEDTLATAEWLVDSGKVRALGAYGYAATQLVEARILSSAGYPRLTVLDVPYSVVRQDELDGDLRLVAGAQGMAVTPSQCPGSAGGRRPDAPRHADPACARRRRGGAEHPRRRRRGRVAARTAHHHRADRQRVRARARRRARAGRGGAAQPRAARRHRARGGVRHRTRRPNLT